MTQPPWPPEHPPGQQPQRSNPWNTDSVGGHPDQPGDPRHHAGQHPHAGDRHNARDRHNTRDRRSTKHQSRAGHQHSPGYQHSAGYPGQQPGGSPSEQPHGWHQPPRWHEPPYTAPPPAGRSLGTHPGFGQDPRFAQPWGSAHPGPQPGGRHARARGTGPVLAAVFAIALLFFGGAITAFATIFSSSETTIAGSGYNSPDPQPPLAASPTSETDGASPPPSPNTTDTDTSGTARSTTDTAMTRSMDPNTNTLSRTGGSFAEPVAALGGNPVNIQGNGAMNTACDLPRFGTDAREQNAFYEAALPCLMEAWSPMLADANLPTTPPKVVTTEESVDTPCGRRAWDQTAMYCGVDHTIYMTARYYSEVEGQTDPGVYLGQFAHEFGHAMQGLSGISGAYDNALNQAGGYDSAHGAELSRRSELQATCYGGMSLAALQNGGVSNDYIFPALNDAGQRGDERTNGNRDHGSLANNQSWVQRGFYTNRVAKCNTWRAADTAVR